MTSPFCIFTSAGDHHNIRQWLPAAQTQPYRINVVSYGDRPFDVQHPALRHWKHKGYKFPNLKWWFDGAEGTRGRGADDCEYIAVWDDDTVATETEILALFTKARDGSIDIIQPTGGNTPAYTSLAPSGKGGLREVEFIEVGTPVFKASFLGSFLAEYDPREVLDYGVDIWFSHKCAREEGCRMIVDDDVHTENPPVRSNGLREVESAPGFWAAEKMWEAYSQRHGLPRYPPYSAFRTLRFFLLIYIWPRLFSLLTLGLPFAAVVLLLRTRKIWDKGQRGCCSGKKSLDSSGHIHLL
mmetsp:Transcript_30303/g.56225  ORF Transcript_30303/g.56225 Transcript_30303/m.56225 type:complete len:297 (-) Transcript_30303:87-977(-)